MGRNDGGLRKPNGGSDVWLDTFDELLHAVIAAISREHAAMTTAERERQRA